MKTKYPKVTILLATPDGKPEKLITGWLFHLAPGIQCVLHRNPFSHSYRSNWQITELKTGRRFDYRDGSPLQVLNWARDKITDLGEEYIRNAINNAVADGKQINGDP